MVTALDYLEQAKAEELAREYQERGYRVVGANEAHGAQFDLIAQKGQETIAFAIKALDALASEAETVKQLRVVAQDNGYVFKLYVVNPPRERAIEFPDLAAILLRHLATHLPTELARLAERVTVERVGRLDLDAVILGKEGPRVRGMGMLEATLDYGSGGRETGFAADFPFTFDISLDPQLAMVGVDTLDIDVSSFDDDSEAG